MNNWFKSQNYWVLGLCPSSGILETRMPDDGQSPRTIDSECYIPSYHMDYFTKWPEAYAIPNQEDSTVAEVLVNNFFCRFGIPRSYLATKAVTSSLLYYKKCYSASEWAKRAPCPCTHSRMAWLSATSRRSKSTYERSSRRIRGTGTRDYTFSS
jgi:hypothetical protein